MMTRGPIDDPVLRQFEGLEVTILDVKRSDATLPGARGGFRSQPSLTRAEREVLEGLLSGLRMEQIARRRGTSEVLVWSQVARIFRAFGVVSRGELLVRCRGLSRAAY